MSSIMRAVIYMPGLDGARDFAHVIEATGPCLALVKQLRCELVGIVRHMGDVRRLAANEPIDLVLLAGLPMDDRPQPTLHAERAAEIVAAFELGREVERRVCDWWGSR